MSREGRRGERKQAWRSEGAVEAARRSSRAPLSHCLASDLCTLDVLQKGPIRPRNEPTRPAREASEARSLSTRGKGGEGSRCLVREVGVW